MGRGRQSYPLPEWASRRGCPSICHQSGRGAAWQRAAFGTLRSSVQIRPSRLVGGRGRPHGRPLYVSIVKTNPMGSNPISGRRNRLFDVDSCADDGESVGGGAPIGNGLFGAGAGDLIVGVGGDVPRGANCLFGAFGVSGGRGMGLDVSADGDVDGEIALIDGERSGGLNRAGADRGAGA